MKQKDQPVDSDSDQTMEARIQLEEIRMLHGSMMFSMLATFAVSLIMYLVMLGHADSTGYLSLWFAVMVASILLRSWDSYCFSKASADEQGKESWSTRFLAGCTFAGFWWGMLSWLGYSAENEYQTLIVVCIVGVAGGSLATLSYRWKTIAFFLMPALILLEIRLILEDKAFFEVVSYLLAVYILFTLSTSRRAYKNSNQNIRLRIEADFREEALKAAKNDAEMANKAKSIFLSSMSHELRTPLNAITGYTQLLEHDETLDHEHKDNIKEISNAGQLLLELVNQILDLSSIEEGKLKVSLEPVALENTLRECKSLIQPLADKKHIRLDFITDFKGYVLADHTRLKQIMLNLLTNAIKYNHENGAVSVRCNHTAGKRVRIEVKDTGYGIPQDKLESLFEPFNRLRTGLDNIEGTGIGLTIAKRLTKMMRGTLDVQSEAGQGSTFWIELEGVGDSAIHATGKEHPDFSNNLETTGNDHVNSKRILVVEDNPSNLKLISSQLSVLGYKADLASNGKEALKKYSANEYSLILTDCNMPIMNGYDLTSAIRKENTDIPVIALTADAFPEQAQDCITAGMNDRIVKPVSLQQLNGMLEKWLSAP
ncbi:MAG: response regulator [Gammaproteobacteria bacterium]|jgi:signal transduction histidine kinase